LAGSDEVDKERRQAEVFDALGHPTRIMILKALSEESIGFADLKKKLKMESSGHLQHHLNKLGDLVKTDEYGKYALSDQGRDALVSVETVESVAKSETKQNKKPRVISKNAVLRSAVIALAVLLIVSSAVTLLEYHIASSYQNLIAENNNAISQLNSTALQLNGNISQLNSEIEQRDTFILQLDTALNLTQSLLNLTPPTDSQYLTTAPDSNNQGNFTKIFLESTAAWYHYEPGYPFNISWFNTTTGYGSSQKPIPLTDNRSVPVSFYGFNIGSNENYEYAGEGGEPYLMIGITIRNDYTAADAGNGSDPNTPIGNSTSYYHSVYNITSQYRSFINLSIKLISQNGSAIPADLSGIQSPRNLNTLERGGEIFSIGSGETRQVVFYLYPSSLDIKSFEIYVSYLSSVSPTF